MSGNGEVSRLLFVGTHGHVVALDKATGERIWERSLPRTGYAIVSIVYEDALLFCACGGKVFALDPATGEIRWTNDLPGMGSGMVFLSTAQSNATEGVMSLFAAAAAAQQQQAAASGAP